MFDDLWYVKFHQQELWRAAAAQALAAQFQPERRGWRTRLRDALHSVLSVFSRSSWRASGPVRTCPVHAVPGMTQTPHGGQNV